MFAPSTLEQQLAATWNAARTDPVGGGDRPRLAARRRLVQRLVRGGR